MPWLTPDSIPEADDCRPLSIPASSEWLALVSGALTELTKKYNWQKFGTLTVDETVAKMNEIVNNYYDAGCAACTLPDGGRIIRIGEGGHLQELGDDGSWQDATGDYAIPPPSPREGGTPQDQKCLAATNATNVLEKLYEDLTDSWNGHLSEAEAATSFTLTLIGLVGFEFAPITASIVAFFAVVFSTLYSALAYIGADIWDDNVSKQIRCFLIECAHNEDGVVTFDWDCFNAKLNSLTDSFGLSELQVRLYLQIGFMLYFIGGVDGLNLAARTTEITEADCEECGCVNCHEFDFTLSDWGFVALSPADTFWTAGIGWQSNVGAGVFCTIAKSFTADNICSFELFGAASSPLGTGGGRGYWLNDTGSGAFTTPSGWNDIQGEFDTTVPIGAPTSTGMAWGMGIAGFGGGQQVIFKKLRITTSGSDTLDGEDC